MIVIYDKSKNVNYVICVSMFPNHLICYLNLLSGDTSRRVWETNSRRRKI